MPGPHFTFAAYLGAVMRPAPNGIAGMTIELVALFLPGLLLVGALSFWDFSLEARGPGGNARRDAAVVEILGAALCP